MVKAKRTNVFLFLLQLSLNSPTSSAAWDLVFASLPLGQDSIRAVVVCAHSLIPLLPCLHPQLQFSAKKQKNANYVRMSKDQTEKGTDGHTTD